MAPMTVSEILAVSGLNKTELSKRFSIPYKTVQNWCGTGKAYRPCPVYVRLMMQEILDIGPSGNAEE